MKTGRKHMKKLAEERKFTIPDGECIMQVVSLRGSNLVEVMDAIGEKSLALIPAKFQKTMWIKRGNFVLVDETGREQALESGSKITCVVTRVLFHEQVRQLQKSTDWPELFRMPSVEPSNATTVNVITGSGQKQPCASDTEDYNGLPPLEANMNRAGMPEWHSDTESSSDTE